uniref:Uncharacterized protein n=1 Tax=Anguilla anguilla TaxID=7936 RepID=A0A0E9QSI0_ANGAN
MSLPLNSGSSSSRISLSSSFRNTSNSSPVAMATLLRKVSSGTARKSLSLGLTMRVWPFLSGVWYRPRLSRKPCRHRTSSRETRKRPDFTISA